MKNNRNIRRMISVLLILAMLLPCISMTAFSQDLPCAEAGCSGKYRSGMMWFGAFPGAFGLGRAQPQRRGTSP